MNPRYPRPRGAPATVTVTPSREASASFAPACRFHVRPLWTCQLSSLSRGFSGRSIRHQVYENRPWGLSLGRPPARAVRSYPGTRSPAGAAGSRDAMYPGRFGAWLVVNVFRISRHSEGAIVFSGAFRARVRAGCRGFMAWMPRSCRKNDMVVAFTSYGLAGRNRGRGISGHGSSPGARGTRGKAWGRGGGRRGGGAGGGGRRGLSGPFGIN